MHIETGFDENIKTCIGMRKKENKYIYITKLSTKDCDNNDKFD